MALSHPVQQKQSSLGFGWQSTSCLPQQHCSMEHRHHIFEQLSTIQHTHRAPLQHLRLQTGQPPHAHPHEPCSLTHTCILPTNKCTQANKIINEQFAARTITQPPVHPPCFNIVSPAGLRVLTPHVSRIPHGTASRKKRCISQNLKPARRALYLCSVCVQGGR